MSLASDYAGVLRGVVDRIVDGCGALTALAVELIEQWQVVVGYAEESRGPQSGLVDSVAQLNHALDEIERVQALAERVIADVVVYLADIGFEVSPEQGVGVASRAPHWLDVDAVVLRRRQLPADIPRKNTGRKTHGLRVRSDGTEGRIVSGDDAAQQLAGRFLDEFGMGTLLISSHAEMKLAAILRDTHDRTGQVGHATIVLNYRPCLGPRSCLAFLAKVLPVGCSVTVHGSGGYYRRFRGEHR